MAEAGGRGLLDVRGQIADEGVTESDGVDEVGDVAVVRLGTEEGEGDERDDPWSDRGGAAEWGREGHVRQIHH